MGFLFFQTTAQAAQYATASEPSGVGGVRLALIRPMLNSDVKASYENITVKDSGKVDNTYGLSFGAISMPIGGLGWSTNVAYFQSKSDSVDDNVNLVRLDANLGSGINRLLNFKGGVNVFKIMSGEWAKYSNPELGFQLSLGLQLTRNFGFDFGYTEMNTNGRWPVISEGQEVGRAQVHSRLSGAEISMTGTF